MSWVRYGLVACALACLLVMTLGCGGSSTTKTSSRTSAQYFRNEQGSTVTPSGKIQMHTIEEKDGQIHYQTEDGKKWRVRYSKRATTATSTARPRKSSSLVGTADCPLSGLAGPFDKPRCRSMA